jgi:transposase
MNIDLAPASSLGDQSDEIFLAYLDEVLCPKLRRGDVVVMDNLSSHEVKWVLERIEAVGAQLLYLPPYSPDLNPIE